MPITYSSRQIQASADRRAMRIATYGSPVMHGVAMPKAFDNHVPTRRSERSEVFRIRVVGCRTDRLKSRRSGHQGRIFIHLSPYREGTHLPR